MADIINHPANPWPQPDGPTFPPGVRAEMDVSIALMNVLDLDRLPVNLLAAFEPHLDDLGRAVHLLRARVRAFREAAGGAG